MPDEALHERARVSRPAPHSRPGQTSSPAGDLVRTLVSAGASLAPQRAGATPALDQAATLRRLFAGRAPACLPIAARRGAHAGIVANLGAAAARLGHRVVLIDETPGEIARALDLLPRLELAHALSGERSLAQVMLAADAGLAVLPATRGLARAAQSGMTVRDILRELPAAPDLAIIYAEATRLAGRLIPGGPALILPVAVGADGVTDAYAQLKQIAIRGDRVIAVLYGAPEARTAHAAFESLAAAAERFLGACVEFAGFVPTDGAYLRATRERRPVFEVDAQAASARALEALAGRIDAAAAPRAPLTH
jgi:flagellar biosynthesis protein FlhG